MSEPYTSPPGCHRHWCHRCGHVWQHADGRKGDREAHTCPACRTLLRRWMPYEGDQPPMTVEAKESRP